ncbi:prepilin-type N-terminal cleavage/methylation domain-containing protein [Chromohalobacter sp. 11-W]|uniref:PilW family protein n=1 Tax=Chromohalobacter sp. 11-W TaxID=2994061 RepID=UPI0024699587|nr:prepilin-type N-terminal cleavage/methylation domain-containing protein [Chromohalobacter sp. 11-W]
MNNRQRQSGFTLIEMMISMLLGLVILGGTITAYQAISSVSEQRDNYYKLQDELMYIHRALASSVKVAKSVEINKGLNSLTLESYSGDGVRGIKCPGFDKGDAEVEWMTVHSGDNEQVLKCKLKSGREVEVISLVSKGSVGITSINFCSLPYDDEKQCGAGKSNSGIAVTVKYYDLKCDPDDESCDEKSVSFRLATRAPTSALGVGR